MVIVEVELRTKDVIKILHGLRELRIEVMKQPGYVSSNTLVGVEEPSLISVLTIWQSAKDWKTWEKSQTQIKIFKNIIPLLLEKSKIKIFRYLSYAAKPHISDNSKED
ncbi:antibiotic biosynthesis monooxygenase family protein [Chloroflexota bacterium]